MADQLNFRIRRVLGNGRIVTVAGNGLRGHAGDGGRATEARLDLPGAIARVPDGSLLIAEDGAVRQVGADGIIRTVAGTGIPTDSSGVGDGGPATSAQFDAIRSLAVAPGGGFYVVDGGRRIVNGRTGTSRIRRVWPDGTITTIAGAGTLRGRAADGHAASEAAFFSVARIAALPNGSLLVADTSNDLVRQIRPDGTLVTVAGNGTYGERGDGGPSTRAQLAGPREVTPLPGGAFLILGDEGVIRRVSPGGRISTLNRVLTPAQAGIGLDNLAGLLALRGDGGPLVHAAFPPALGDAAVASDGSLLLADGALQRVAAVVPSGTRRLLAAWVRRRRLQSAGRLGLPYVLSRSARVSVRLSGGHSSTRGFESTSGRGRNQAVIGPLRPGTYRVRLIARRGAQVAADCQVLRVIRHVP